MIENYKNKEDLSSDTMARTFHVLIEQDEDGGFVGRVPEIRGCLSQGDTLNDLMKNIKEAIELCLEVQAVTEEQIKFVGVQEITI